MSQQRTAEFAREREYAKTQWGWYAAKHYPPGAEPAYFSAKAALGYPPGREIVFDRDGNPYPYGWDSVGPSDDPDTIFGTTPDGSTVDLGQWTQPNPVDLAIPYQLPPVDLAIPYQPSPGEELSTHRERAAEIARFARAGCPDPLACGLQYLTVRELRALWDWVESVGAF